jgi:hypothetical protein
MKNGIMILAGALVLASVGKAQPPSEEEIGDLLRKADEKVSAFEKTNAQVEPFIGNDSVYQKNLNATAQTRKIIQAMQAKLGVNENITAYGLVALLSAMDDVTLDASRTGAILLIGKPQLAVLVFPIVDACYDISELIMHATLRQVKWEEDLLTVASKAFGSR